MSEKLPGSPVSKATIAVPSGLPSGPVPALTQVCRNWRLSVSMSAIPNRRTRSAAVSSRVIPVRAASVVAVSPTRGLVAPGLPGDAQEPHAAGDETANAEDHDDQPRRESEHALHARDYTGAVKSIRVVCRGVSVAEPARAGCATAAYSTYWSGVTLKSSG